MKPAYEFVSKEDTYEALAEIKRDWDRNVPPYRS